MFYQTDDFLYSFLIDLICLPFDRCRLLIFIFSLCTGHILRDIHKDRARTTCLGNGKGTADGIRQLIHIFNNKIMLCHRHCNTGDIDFLKTIFAKKIDIDIAGDSDHRNGIHISCRNTCNNIGCSRSGCCQTHTNFTCCTGITICRMGSPLLM